MTALLCALVLSSSGLRPTVAILPPVPKEQQNAWLGLAVADQLTQRLLVHSRFNPKTLQREYPLNVFSWRQGVAAARGEGIDVTRPLDAKQQKRLRAQLGADFLFVASYAVAGESAKLKWRLVGSKEASQGEQSLKLKDLSVGIERMSQAMLKQAEPGRSLAGHRLQTLPLAAIKPFGQALQILAGQSLDPRAHLVLPPAEIHKAHALLTAATEAAPESVRAWVERGVASAMVGNVGQAEEEIVQAMAQAGEFEPLNALGLYYLYDRQGHQDKSIKVLEEATNTHLGFLQGLGYLGQAYARAAENHKALKVFTAYSARVPRNPWVQVRRCTALSRIGKHDLAIQETGALLKRFPRSLMVKIALASRYIDAERMDEASKILEDALKTHKGHAALLTRLSYIRLEQGQAEQALDLAQKAVAAVGDGRGESLAGYAHVNLAHALALVGKNEEGFTALKRAMALGVDGDELLYLKRDKRLQKFLVDPRNPLN